MNFAQNFFEIKDGLRRLKPRVVILTSVAAFVLFVLVVLMASEREAPPRKIDSPFATRAARPQEKLDYNIIKLDTISLGDYFKPQETGLQPAEEPEVAPPPRTKKARSASESSSGISRTPAVVPSNAVVDRNPNMIVHSTMSTNQVSGGRSFGRESALVKVILTDKTSISNGSLVEARVINDASINGIEIPKRSKLVGVASLQTGRIHIDFREVQINNVTRTCNGRAYDLKKLLGLPYSQVPAATTNAVLDELKSAASAVPVVGRYANQIDNNSIVPEVATFDEGYQFYAQINNVF